MTPQKFTATIDPQEWVDDYALSVDPPGETTWDCTAFIKADPERFGDVELTIDEEDRWLDTNDALREDPNAPAWVKEWSGPFTITVSYREEPFGHCDTCGATCDDLGCVVNRDHQIANG
jgi:hypothetical protein